MQGWQLRARPAAAVCSTASETARGRVQRLWKLMSALRHLWGQVNKLKTTKLNGSGVKKAAESCSLNLKMGFLGIRKDSVGTDMGQFALRWTIWSASVFPMFSGIIQGAVQQSRVLLLLLFQFNTDLLDHLSQQ